MHEDHSPLAHPDPVEECIEFLRSHGDFYGAMLLEMMRDVKRVNQRHQENARDT